MKLERKKAFPVVDSKSLLPGPRIFRRKTVFSKKKTPCSHTRSAVSGKGHNEYGLELHTYVTRNKWPGLANVGGWGFQEENEK